MRSFDLLFTRAAAAISQVQVQFLKDRFAPIMSLVKSPGTLYNPNAICNGVQFYLRAHRAEPQTLASHLQGASKPTKAVCGSVQLGFELEAASERAKEAYEDSHQLGLIAGSRVEEGVWVLHIGIGSNSGLSAVLRWA